jgi:DNA-binding NarL/FixJ family response regulator
MRARLVIAEDFEPTQCILCQILEPHYEVVAVVADGRALLAAVEEHRPNVVLSDVAMPVLNGIAAAKRLKATYPAVKIIFVSAHSEKVYKDEAFKLGADGYLLKNSVERELLNAVQCVLSGGIYPSV